ncbi:hypothetical protein [Nocardioides sp. cx-173]|uniref:hypothetical protein n=1 Tax=Nocardioides sp. cx-173 TaxID=2898796 RepID=UPI001E38FCA1|nr:hypothetical protein [Nocardioides sp. cx-173]MCD4524613.1 hypothetical protein [Nocardioides sp. cx-173]UGB42905.1 hypothetical protein LQ940_05120 [Nocardioides sp. cx-173]
MTATLSAFKARLDDSPAALLIVDELAARGVEELQLEEAGRRRHSDEDAARLEHTANPPAPADARGSRLRLPAAATEVITRSRRRE